MQTSESLEKIINIAQEKKLIPFIGAGFSKNLDLPGWDEIVDKLANDAGWDPEIFKIHGDVYQRAEYYEITNKERSSLRIKIKDIFETKSKGIKISASKIHRHLVNIEAPIIYTTNWDSWIEKAYEDHKKNYQVIRNLGDIVKIDRNKTQIVKFHGDFDGKDEDFVFTESSYFGRMDFDSILDIKFKSDILGKSLLFLGYSFADMNIRMLWYNLNETIKKFKKEYDEDYPKSYIVLIRPNPLLEEIFKDKELEIITLDGRESIEIEFELFLEAIVNGMMHNEK
jgi:hypothetical protein